MINRICIIGIGLIGSSLALAIKKYTLATTVIACDINENSCIHALSLGIADEATTDLAQAVQNADIVVLATPVSSIPHIAKTIAPHLPNTAIVTDAGSVKQSIIPSIQQVLPDDIPYIPGHPLAGTENSGVTAGFAELFEDRWCILTPLENTPEHALNAIKTLWENIGSRVSLMTPEHHDNVLALTSHIPHLIAYTIVGTANDVEEDTHKEVVRYAASGFRDFTRIAASDPTMWRDIMLNNKDSILNMLQHFKDDLELLETAIRNENSDILFNHFSKTRKIRREVIEAGQA